MLGTQKEKRLERGEVRKRRDIKRSAYEEPFHWIHGTSRLDLIKKGISKKKKEYGRRTTRGQVGRGI